MFVLGILLLVLAGIVSLISSIMMLVAAFRVSVAWGLLVLFVPFAALVFVIMYWQNAKRAFLYGLAGSTLGVAGFLVVFIGAASEMSMRGAMASAPSGDPVVAAQARRSVPAAQQVVAEPAASTEPGVAAAEAPRPAPSGSAPDASSATGADMTPAKDAAEGAADELLDALAWPANRSTDIAPAEPGVPMQELGQHIGEELILVDGKGVGMRMTLVAVEPALLRVERTVNGGTVRYAVARSDVREVRRAY
ncbi:MAG: hypothetical protein KBD01_14710 [Acidobacteria bacterium]|nr:hypothetical protein [Acidobacteriota bacterium]